MFNFVKYAIPPDLKLICNPRTVSSLKKFGVKAMGFSADVRDFDAIAAGVNDVKMNMGEFDAVVSGAAGNFPAMANDLSPNGFKPVVEIDLRGYG